MAEPTRLGPGFPPLANSKSRILILGTFPSPKSREQQFFYGHPQNRFWPMLAALCGRPTPTAVEEKRSLILENGLALWDTVRCCTIVGASDASIRDVEPNDIPRLCAQYPIGAVLCNGAASWKVYQKYAAPAVHLPAFKMPSTSPANAAWSMARLTEAWDNGLTEARRAATTECIPEPGGCGMMKLL